jgi:kynurenine 3-monooxygenase
MVPFYGQGMNAGFQDCTVFFQIFDQNNGINNLANILEEYSMQRVADSHAICDLALHNYIEVFFFYYEDY